MSQSLSSELVKDALRRLLLSQEADDALPQQLEADAELAGFFRDLFSIRSALAALSEGDLDFTVSGKGYFVGLLKSFQAALRHLTWQTKRVASGYFDQKVDFLGEFSDAFNHMTKSLDGAMKQITTSEQKYKLLFEHAEEAIFIIQDNTLLLWNPMLCTLTGYDDDFFRQVPLFSPVHADDRKKVARFLSPQQQKKAQFGFRLVQKDGNISLMECKSIPILWEEQPAFLCFLSDVTKQKEAVEQLLESEKKFRLIAEYSSDTVWVFNLNQAKLSYISPSVFYLLGYTPEQFKQIRLKDLISPSTYANAKQIVAKAMERFEQNPAQRSDFTIELQLKNSQNEYFWVEISANIRHSTAGEIELVGAGRSVERRKKAEENAIYYSYHDLLTGLYNRRFFEEEFVRVDVEKHLPITVVMADVNGLKMVNDAFGHDAGDVILLNFSDILRKHHSPSDIVCRIGGDEFILLLKNTDGAQAHQKIEAIKRGIKEKNDSKAILSVSFGVATKHKVEESLEEVYRQAETAMYQEKLVESQRMKDQMILQIQTALHEKSEHVKTHSTHVSQICRQIAMALGLDSDAVDEMGLLGMLHDIGKIAVDAELLNKTEELTHLELVKIRRHPEVGYQILRSASKYAHLADYVLAHHERMDGGGYPRQLSGEEIPLQSRILAVAEAYDFMTGTSPGNKGMTAEQACRNLVQNAGSQFDADVVSVFVEKVMGFPMQ